MGGSFMESQVHSVPSCVAHDFTTPFNRDSYLLYSSINQCLHVDMQNLCILISRFWQCVDLGLWPDHVSLGFVCVQLNSVLHSLKKYL